LVVLVLMCMPAGASAQASPPSFEVLDAGDEPDGDLSDGVCSTVDPDSGGPDPATCTLRAAIQEANRAPDRNSITFALPAGATIRLTWMLPPLDQPVEIAGSPATLASTTIPAPPVRIDGAQLDPGHGSNCSFGFHYEGPGSWCGRRTRRSAA
jgi:CSLREA domain-containing protein